MWKVTYPLHASACEGTVDVAKAEIAKGVDVSAQDDDDSGKWTPLHYASWYNQIDIVRLLLASKANVNATNVNGSTPLHYAAGCGHLPIVKLLVESGASKDARDVEKRTPLSLCKEIKQNEWQQIVEYLK